MDTVPIIDFLQAASAPAVAEKLKEIPFTEENVRRVAQEYLNIRDDGVRRELVKFLAGKYSVSFQRIDDSTIRLLMDSIIERGEVEPQSIRNILDAFNFPETRHHNRYFIEKLLEKSDSVTLNPASERDGYYGASITSLIPQEYQSPWIRMCASKGMCRWFTPRIRKDLLVAHRKLLLPPLEEILREVRGKKESAGDVPDETGTIADRTEDLQSIASTVNFMYLGEMNERELSPEETDLAFGSRAERIRFFLNNIGFFVNAIEKTEPLNVRNIVLNYNHGFDRLNEASVAGMDSIEWMDGTGAEELFLRIKDSLGDGNGSGVSLDEAKRFVCGCESLEDKISSIGQNTQKALSDLCLAVITLDAGRYGRFDGDIL